MKTSKREKRKMKFSVYHSLFRFFLWSKKGKMVIQVCCGIDMVNGFWINTEIHFLFHNYNTNKTIRSFRIQIKLNNNTSINKSPFFSFLFFSFGIISSSNSNEVFNLNHWISLLTHLSLHYDGILTYHLLEMIVLKAFHLFWFVPLHFSSLLLFWLLHLLWSDSFSFSFSIPRLISNTQWRKRRETIW